MTSPDTHSIQDPNGFELQEDGTVTNQVDEITLCRSCWCMTKTREGKCGKCKADMTRQLEELRRSIVIELTNHYIEEYRYDHPNKSQEQLFAFARDIAENEIEQLIAQHDTALLEEIYKAVEMNIVPNADMTQGFNFGITKSLAIIEQYKSKLGGK